MNEQVRMRMVALIEALVVLLASVTACGPAAAGPSVRVDAPGAATDKPLCRWEQAPAHPFWLGYQTTRQESSWLEQSTRPGKILVLGTALGVKVDSSCVHSTAPSAGIPAVVPHPSLVSLYCLLIV